MDGFVGQLFFYVCAFSAIVGAISAVASKNTIRGAMGLLMMILSLAGLFLALSAQFLAAIQLIVYAGAIVVLFLFVIMLLGPSASPDHESHGRVARVGGASVFGVASLGWVWMIWKAPKIGGQHPSADFGTIDSLGKVLFSDGMVPFELSSALLMVAVVGAVAIARGKHSSNPVIGGRGGDPKLANPKAGEAR